MLGVGETTAVELVGRDAEAEGVTDGTSVADAVGGIEGLAREGEAVGAAGPEHAITRAPHAATTNSPRADRRSREGVSISANVGL